MPSLRELQDRCQKPHWREVGSLLARRLARPLAIHLTWLIVRFPVSANAITSVTLVVGLAAAALLGMQPVWAFVAGVLVLNLWYLLDHVDGQVARFRRTESVTGIYLDYMMHHAVHPACAFALGYRVASWTGNPVWTLAGAGFALGLVLLSVSNDCRYKAFVAELTRGGRTAERGGPESAGVHGQSAIGPFSSSRTIPSNDRTLESSAPPPAALCPPPWMIVHHALRKACEFPNVIVALNALAILVAGRPVAGFQAIAGYLLFMGVLAPLLAFAHAAKQVVRHLPDAELSELSRAGGFRVPTRPCLHPELPASQREASLLTVHDLLRFADDTDGNSDKGAGEHLHHGIAA
jgi:hypothetical protein